MAPQIAVRGGRRKREDSIRVGNASKKRASPRWGRFRRHHWGAVGRGGKGGEVGCAAADGHKNKQESEQKKKDRIGKEMKLCRLGVHRARDTGPEQGIDQGIKQGENMGRGGVGQVMCTEGGQCCCGGKEGY